MELETADNSGRRAAFEAHRGRLRGVAYRLAPEERAAFLLHDVFESDYHEIAGALGKSEAACRQIVSRARRRQSEGRAEDRARRRERRALPAEKIAVNGETGLAVRVDGQLVSVMSFATDGRQILGVYSVLNPDKLRGVPPAHAH